MSRCDAHSIDRCTLPRPTLAVTVVAIVMIAGPAVVTRADDPASGGTTASNTPLSIESPPPPASQPSSDEPAPSSSPTPAEAKPRVVPRRDPPRPTPTQPPPEPDNADPSPAARPDVVLPEREFLPLVTAPGAATGTSQTRPANVGSWGLQTAMALGVVIMLVVLLRVFLKRVNGAGAQATSRGGMVEVLSRSTVGPKTQVLLLKVNHRVIIAGQTQAGLNTLGVIDDPTEVAQVLAQAEAARPASISQSFSRLLSNFEKQSNELDDRDTDLSFDSKANVDVAPSDSRLDRTRGELAGLAARLRRITGTEGGK